MSDPAAAIDRGPLAPGQRLGRYEVAAELAAGGMATVYLARATGLAGFERLVALKCVHRRLAREPGFIEMFLDEARIASRITHPNVASVFDVGEEAGIHYLAMDYLHGESLASVLGSVAMNPSVRAHPTYVAYVTSIIASAAEGLHAAHELRGDDGALLEVVHRDVSPHNIFVTYDGAVRVVDFGIARAAGRLHKTLSGTIKGKVAYMSPEQLRGEELDRRTDIWALGVTLWELLALRRLFKHESQGKTIDAVLGQEVPPPSRFAPHVGPELDAIVLRALARDPDDRYATSRELDRDLRRTIAATGELVGMAELAEWMDYLFADHRAAKQRMIEQARSGAVVADVPDTQRFAQPPPDLVPTAIEERSDVRPSTREREREGMTTLRQGTIAGPRTETETIRDASPPAAAGAPLPALRPAPALTPTPARTPTPTNEAETATAPTSTLPRDPDEAPTHERAPAVASHPSMASVDRPTYRTESVVLPVRRLSRAWVVAGGLGLLAVGAAVVGLLREHASSAGDDTAIPTPLEAPSPPSTMAMPPTMDAPPTTPAPAEEETSMQAAGADRRSPGDAERSRTDVETHAHRERRGSRHEAAARSGAAEEGAAETTRPAVPAPATPAPAALGTVTVGVRGGWGAIEVDGQPAGQSPRELSLRAGPHVVVVRPFGDGAPVRRDVVVRGGETTRLVVDAEAP